jgi:hypothetical protein
MIPYLIYSHNTYGDYMISSNIHAVWWRNYEFIEFKQIECDGCPSFEEYDRRLYLGEPVSMWEYVFGMHSLGELSIRTVEGFRLLYLAHSEYWMSMIGKAGLIWYLLYLIGAVRFLFSDKMVIFLLPLLISAPLLFSITINMPPRLFIANAPFMALLLGYGSIQITRIANAGIRRAFSNRR